MNGQPMASGQTITDEGAYTLRVDATDRAGNVAQTELSFNIDLTPPSVTTNLVDQAILTEPTAIEATCTDDNPATTEVILDGVVVQPGEVISSDGTHVVQVTCTDCAGNELLLNRIVYFASTGLLELAQSETVVPEVGGTTELSGYASVAIPAASNLSGIPIEVSAVVSGQTPALYELTPFLYDIVSHTPYEIRISTGDIQPDSVLTVALSVPDNLLQQSSSDEIPVALVSVLQDGGEELLDGFEPFVSEYDQLDRIVTVRIPGWVFTNGRRSDGRFEAILLLSSRRNASRNVPQSLASADANCPIELAFPMRDNSFPISSPVKVRCDDPGETHCRIHAGVDIDTRGETGKDVVAATDGTVVKVGTQYKKDPKGKFVLDNNGNKIVTGYGNYMIVEGRSATGSLIRTLYGHLDQFSVNEGDDVTAGVTAIAKSGNTGTSSGPHLHFEVFDPDCVWPTDDIFRCTRVNPEPCIVRSDLTYAIVNT